MPFVDLTEEAVSPARRVLLIGGVNTHKTTSILGWPRPSYVISAPGEKGYETLRKAGPGLTAKIYEVEDPGKLSATSVVSEIEKATWEALSTPGLQTFAMDGLHKLNEWYYRKAKDALAGLPLAGRNADESEHEEKRKLAAYGNASGGAYADFMLYLTKVLSSSVPYVVMTCWIEAEPDEVVVPGAKVTTHDFPALPGRLAKRIVGEFGMTLACQVGLPDPKGHVPSTWQLKKEGRIWGVGVKVNPDLAKKLPASMPQDFQKLEALLGGNA